MKKKGLKIKLLKRVREEIYVKKTSVFGHNFFEIIMPSEAYLVQERAGVSKVNSSMEMIVDIVRKARLNLARHYSKGKSRRVRKIQKEDILNI